MRNELALQIKESTAIREAQSAELGDIVRQIPAIEIRAKEAEREFNSNSRSWRPASQIAMQQLSREIGRAEQELKHTSDLLKLAELLNSQN